MLSPALDRLCRLWPRRHRDRSRVHHPLGRLTSIFFFDGVDRIFPFVYASEPWLP